MEKSDGFAPQVGVPCELTSDLSLVLAPNASPMTYLGTNSYLLGQRQLAVVDPGPDDPTHLAALLAVIDGRPVTHIFVTHSHLDHSPLARRLSEQTAAPVYAFGDSLAGRSAVMQALAADGYLAGGEGVDHAFAPDYCLADMEIIEGPEWILQALHTPGHMGNHICLRWQDTLFCGDHVMGWASSLVSPPDGDLTDFMKSCERLEELALRCYFPGHGAPITDPQARLAWLIAHRRSREAQVLAALCEGPCTLSALTRVVYADVDQAMWPAAERNLFAHLIDLVTRRIVVADPRLEVAAKFQLSEATELNVE